MRRAVALLAAISVMAPIPGALSTPQEGRLWSVKLERAPVPKGFTLPTPMPLAQGVVAVYPSITSVSLLDVGEGGASPLWTVDLGRVPVSQFTSSGEFVYVLTWARKPWSTRLYAIRVSDGAMPWPDGVELDTALRDVPIVYGGGVVAVPMESGEVWGIGAEYGNKKWSVRLSGTAKDMMLVSGILVVMDGAGVVGIDPGTGAVLWKFDSGDEPVAMGRYGTAVYVVTEGSTLYGIDPTSGNKLGEAQLPREPPVPGRIPVWADAVLVATQRAKIFAVGARSYDVSSLPRYLDLLPARQPSLVNGLLLAAGKFGEVYFMDWNPRGVMPTLLESSLPDAPASDFGLTPDGEIALIYSADGSLTAFRVPLLQVYPRGFEVQGDGIQLDFVACAFLSTSSPGVITVTSPLGDVLAQEDFLSFADGGCMEDLIYVPGATAYDRIYLSASVGARTSPEEEVQLAVGPLPQPPAAAGSPANLVIPPGAVVGEPTWIGVNVTNVWGEGEISVSASGEGISVFNASPVHLGPNSSTLIRLEATPLRQGELKVNVSILLDGVEVYSIGGSLRAAAGSIIDRLSPASEEVTLGDVLSLRVTLTNRYRDGATFTLRLGDGGLSQLAPVTVGPLRAGESVNATVEGVASAQGVVKPVVSVLADGSVIDSAEAGEVRVVSLPPPPPGRAPPQGQQPSGVPWIGIPWETAAAAAAVVMVGAAVYLLGRRGGGARPAPRTPTAPAGPAAPIRPPPPGAPPEETAGEGAVEVGASAPVSEAEVEPLEESLSRRLRAVRSDLEAARGRLSEGIPGLEGRLREVAKVVSEAEVALGLGDLEHAGESVRRAEEAMDSLRGFLDQYDNVFRGPGWSQVERRITTMLKVWGRAPATMLTMVPPEMRLAALQRYLESHRDANLELRGDELRLVEGG